MCVCCMKQARIKTFLVSLMSNPLFNFSNSVNLSALFVECSNKYLIISAAEPPPVRTGHLTSCLFFSLLTAS